VRLYDECWIVIPTDPLHLYLLLRDAHASLGD
jgi:hypothetical protein